MEKNISSLYTQLVCPSKNVCNDNQTKDKTTNFGFEIISRLPGLA